MTVPSDFMMLMPTWHLAQQLPLADALGCRVVPLYRRVLFDHDQHAAPPDLAGGYAAAAPQLRAADGGGGGRKWSARVLMVHGLDAAAREDVVRMPHADGGKGGPPSVPLANSLR